MVKGLVWVQDLIIHTYIGTLVWGDDFLLNVPNVMCIFGSSERPAHKIPCTRDGLTHFPNYISKATWGDKCTPRRWLCQFATFHLPPEQMFSKKVTHPRWVTFFQKGDPSQMGRFCLYEPKWPASRGLGLCAGSAEGGSLVGHFCFKWIFNIVKFQGGARGCRRTPLGKMYLIKFVPMGRIRGDKGVRLGGQGGNIGGTRGVGGI